VWKYGPPIVGRHSIAAGFTGRFPYPPGARYRNLAYTSGVGNNWIKRCLIFIDITFPMQLYSSQWSHKIDTHTFVTIRMLNSYLTPCELFNLFIVLIYWLMWFFRITSMCYCVLETLAEISRFQYIVLSEISH